MQTSAIYNPHKHATPSQRLAAAAHRERLGRLHSGTYPSFDPIKFSPPVAPKTLPPIPNTEIARATEIAIRLCLPPLGEVEKIQRAVCVHFPEITVTDLKSSRREYIVVRPRQIAMYLIKTLTGQSLPAIGRRFGDRDHTTVLHAIRKIQELIGTDPAIAADVDAIKAHLAEMG